MPGAGDFRVICQFSGFKCWASETAFTWDGLRVRSDFLGAEHSRHPQEFVRAKVDNQRVYKPSPDTEDVFLSPGDVTPSDL